MLLLSRIDILKDSTLTKRAYHVAYVHFTDRDLIFNNTIIKPSGNPNHRVLFLFLKSRAYSTVTITRQSLGSVLSKRCP